MKVGDRILLKSHPGFSRLEFRDKILVIKKISRCSIFGICEYSNICDGFDLYLGNKVHCSCGYIILED